ncbi:MAG TPA: hypothetical protein PLO16_11470 [Acidocella sp.]|nr:hypothetical protein [Acidocella sp.]
MSTYARELGDGLDTLVKLSTGGGEGTYSAVRGSLLCGTVEAMERALHHAEKVGQAESL